MSKAETELWKGASELRRHPIVNQSSWPGVYTTADIQYFSDELKSQIRTPESKYGG